MFSLVCLQSLAKYTPQQINKDIEELFSIVPRYEKVAIKGEFYKLDMKNLLLKTAIVESTFATGSYLGRIPKTFMQLEKQTALYGLSQAQLRRDIEKKIGRKLVWNRDRDAVFVAYMVYKQKLRSHPKWLDKYKKQYFDGDVEYFVYKIMYNSILGSATHSMWSRKTKQYWYLTRRK